MMGLDLAEWCGVFITLWAVGIVGYFIRDSVRVWRRYEAQQRAARADRVAVYTVRLD